MRNKVIPTLLSLTLLLAASARAEQGWQSFWSIPQLQQAIANDPKLLVVDVRSASEFAEGHIPGAINIPGASWRTPEAKPGKGDSQYIFRDASGRPDVAKYEALLSAAGITREDRVVIYGNHAGKADGSVPAMILSWLGQKDVAFVDGIGASEWQQAGQSLNTTTVTRPPTKYIAAPSAVPFVWNLSDVLENLTNPAVRFVDNRSKKEFTGEDLRNNRRGGHIPGAVHLNYEDLFDSKTKRILPADRVAQLIAQRRLNSEDTIVLYCQTATRSSLPYLALRDLGFKNVAIYDASWHEYGNRDDTPIERIEVGGKVAAGK